MPCSSIHLSHIKTQSLNQEIHNAIGFRHVMDLLAGVKKPLVGHNMLLDLVRRNLRVVHLGRSTCHAISGRGG